MADVWPRFVRVREDVPAYLHCGGWAPGWGVLHVGTEILLTRRNEEMVEFVLGTGPVIPGEPREGGWVHISRLGSLEEMSAVTPVLAALKSFERVCSSLGISAEEQCKILGDSDERLGYFLVVVDLADQLVGKAEHWLRADNTAEVFNGRPPLDLMIADREGLLQTLNYLKSTYGGWA